MCSESLPSDGPLDASPPPWRLAVLRRRAPYWRSAQAGKTHDQRPPADAGSTTIRTRLASTSIFVQHDLLLTPDFAKPPILMQAWPVCFRGYPPRSSPHVRNRHTHRRRYPSRASAPLWQRALPWLITIICFRLSLQPHRRSDARRRNRGVLPGEHLRLRELARLARHHDPLLAAVSVHRHRRAVAGDRLVQRQHSPTIGCCRCGPAPTSSRSSTSRSARARWRCI